MIDPEAMAEDRQAKIDIEALENADKERALAAAESLLGWLDRRTGERTDGDD